MLIAGFDWDEGNRRKCEKHGVAMTEIEESFRNGPRVTPDLAHSTTEERLIAVGRTVAGRALFVAFTHRRRGEQVLIRPITARFMHAKESEAYDAQDPQARDR